jgi:hypothetical protein
VVVVTRRALFASAGLAGVALAVLSCKPNLDDTTSIVTTTTVLAVQSSPAEAPPSTAVKYLALVAGPDGDVHSAPVRWSYCSERNPLSNLGPVAVQCVEPGNAALQSIGAGLTASAAIPDVACTNFGPNPPAATAGQPAGRPVDPDTTGGYYQPVSVFLPEPGGTQILLYDMRLSCGFAGANEDSQGELQARYHLNDNPAVAATKANGSVLALDGAGKTNTVASGQTVALEVSWPTCPLVDVCGDGICGADESLKSCPADCKTPHGCGGAERYVNFDLGSQGVIDARESIQVSWYATGGSFGNDSTGRESGDTAVTSDNSWQAPSQATTVHLWAVLHDARGGIGWASYTLDVK